MKFKTYSEEDFNGLPRGCYYIINGRKITDQVMIYQGSCFHFKTRKRIKRLKSCFLQKFRELNWVEEDQLDDKIPQDTIDPVTARIIPAKSKVSDQERRRAYFQTKEEPAPVPRKYNINAKSVRREPSLLFY